MHTTTAQDGHAFCKYKPLQPPKIRTDSKPQPTPSLDTNNTTRIVDEEDIEVDIMEIDDPFTSAAALLGGAAFQLGPPRPLPPKPASIKRVKGKHVWKATLTIPKKKAKP